MIRTEHNLQTGEIIEIELTAKEITDLNKQWAEEAVRTDNETNEAETKANLKAALLDKLGISEEEAKLLLS
jgi:TusA-related sulfurtransferase